MFFGNKLIIDSLYQLWEKDIIQNQTLQNNYDYGIVLGGFSSFDHKKNRVQFNKSGDRLFSAVELYKRNVINKIIISGGNGNLINNGYKESIWIKDYLLKIGIKEQDILIDSNSRNTWENAKETYELIKNMNNLKILLITSSWHMKRAKFCFEKNYMKPDTYCTGYTFNNNTMVINYILPQSESFEKWECILKEIIGIIVYNLKY
tara:strand:- start:24953 stop:25567 length:615 start_codon:yes stop_codon:yes gene_type:complete